MNLQKGFYITWSILVLVVGLLLFAMFGPAGSVDLVQQGVTNFSALTLSGNLIVGGTTTITGTTGFTGNVTFAGLADLNGVADALVLDADGDTTLSASTDDTILVEIGGADEISITASTLALADMVISQTIGTENIGVPTVLKVQIDIDNDSSPFTCATIADGEIWLIHYVYATVLDNFATGGSNDATFDVGDGGDQDGLLDLDDAELQAADTEGTGAPAGWQGFMSADTVGAYLGVGLGFPYAPSGAAETIDCTFAGTGLASDTADTAKDITIYIVYTRIQ